MIQVYSDTNTKTQKQSARLPMKALLSMSTAQRHMKRLLLGHAYLETKVGVDVVKRLSSASKEVEWPLTHKFLSLGFVCKDIEC